MQKSLANAAPEELAQELKDERRRAAMLDREAKRAAKDAELRNRAAMFARMRAAGRRDLLATIARHETGRDAVVVKAAMRLIKELEAEHQL